MTGAARAALSGLLAICFAGSPLRAQGGVATDAGVALVSFPEDRRLIAGPWIRVAAVQDGLDVLRAASLNVVLGPSAVSGSGDISSWWRTALGAGWSMEAGGELSALFGSAARTSENVVAGVRVLHAAGPLGGIWLRGSGHGARREAGSLGGGSVDLGLWRRTAFGAVGATVSRETTQGQLFADDARGRVLGTVPVRYVEALASATGVAGNFAFDLTAGARRDPDAAERTELMFGASVQLWLAASRAITFTVARQPADFVHGADASRPVSVGMRFGGRPRRPGIRRMARPAGPVLAVVATAGADRRIVVQAPGASTVELMADFTGWAPVTLRRVDDGFALELPLSSGIHHVAIRVDGGAWMPPANTPAIDDDFGGRVGMVVVP